MYADASSHLLLQTAPTVQLKYFLSLVFKRLGKTLNPQHVIFGHNEINKSHKA